MIRAIYGIKNIAYFCGSSCHGIITWYASRSTRDTAINQLRERAMADGLSHTSAYAGIRSVRNPIRGEAKNAWLEDLIAHGELHEYDEPHHEWMPDINARSPSYRVSDTPPAR